MMFQGCNRFFTTCSWCHSNAGSACFLLCAL